ncbi:DoxX family protein [Haloarchaeobius amylolyticus]|uniref:DoxX family protein n=1 Tax=Haloarchaeobius amylolyticus TaxID=1198296 RepID=UPI00226FD988|nr:DoxX family protein [Haloarchaeobius amylolyticus]
MSTVTGRLGLDRLSNADVSVLSLRVGVGLIMLVHGLGKLTGAGPAGSGIDGFAFALAGLGVPAPILTAWLVGFAETIGGLLVLVGLFSRVGAAAIAVVMTGAILLVHLPNGFVVSNGGYEFALLLLLVSVSLVFTDPGRYSVAHWLADREAEKTARPAA